MTQETPRVSPLLGGFPEVLALAATRNGQMLNRSELASPLGVSVPTISEWRR